MVVIDRSLLDNIVTFILNKKINMPKNDTIFNYYPTLNENEKNIF